MKVHTMAPGRGAYKINIYRTGLMRRLGRLCKLQKMGKIGYVQGKIYFFSCDVFVLLANKENKMASIRVTLWGTREEVFETLHIAYANWTVIDETPILSKDRSSVIGWRFLLSNNIV